MTDPNVIEMPIICPYDKNHKIAPSRIQTHLVKCSKNFPPDYKVNCPYNATHRLFPSEVQEHVLKCRDHRHVNPGIYEALRQKGAEISSVTSESLSVIDSQESWDDEDENTLYPIMRPSNCQYATSMGRVSRINFNNREQRYIVPSKPSSTSTRTRPPSGLAEALMMEQSGESTVEDIESVESFMGVGRGKPWSRPEHEMVMKVGRGRGSAQAKTEN